MNRSVFILIATSMYSTAAIAAPVNWTDVHNEGMQAASRLEFKEAALAFEQSLQVAATPTQRAVTEQDLGIVLLYAGQNQAAGPWLTKAVADWRRAAPKAERLPQAMQQLALSRHFSGDYAGAEKLLREALELPQITKDTKAKALTALADILHEEGNLREARQLLRDAAAIAGVGWQVQLDALIGLASLDREFGDVSLSADEWTQAIEICRQRNSTQLEAVSLRGLAETKIASHDVAQAEPLLRRSIRVLEGPGGEPLQLANSLRVMAQIYAMDGKFALAEDALQRALSLTRPANGPVHPQAAALLDVLAEVQTSAGNLEAGLKSLEEAREILVATFGADSVQVIMAGARKGILEQRAKHSEEAVRDLGASLAALRHTGPDLARERHSLLIYYAAALKQTHRNQEARAVEAEIKADTTME